MRQIEFTKMEEDLKIKNALTERGVITTPRIIMCGQWFNKLKKEGKQKKIKSARFFCMRIECRMCRRKILRKTNMQHILHNNMFINKGGKLILIYLKIPDFIFNHDVDNYKKFKRALALLKESRGWKKLKDFTNAQFHYDNIELLFKNNKYQIIDNIVYGTMKEDVLLDYIEEIVSEYWTRCSKRIGLSIIPKNSVQVAYAIEKNSVINNNFKIFNNNLFEKSFELKRKTIGSLEYLEDQFIKIDSQPETSLVSFEYIKNKKLKEIGNIIKNINTMTRKSRQGRIWQYI